MSCSCTSSEFFMSLTWITLYKPSPLHKGMPMGLISEGLIILTVLIWKGHPSGCAWRTASHFNQAVELLHGIWRGSKRTNLVSVFVWAGTSSLTWLWLAMIPSSGLDWPTPLAYTVLQLADGSLWIFSNLMSQFSPFSKTTVPYVSTHSSIIYPIN